MKALSVRQPWAWAIVQGYKPVENRSRMTSVRGRILIHASLQFDKKGLEFIRDTMGIAVPDTFDQGAIVGSVEIVDCMKKDFPIAMSHPGFEYRENPWFFGPVGYVLREPQASITPFPAKGKLGFWNFYNKYVAEELK